MFKIRYNFLAVIQVLLLSVNAVILIRVFGTSPQADSYLIANSIMDALTLVQLLLVEQFMYFYHEIKNENLKEAHSFYNATIFISISSGLAFFLILFIGLNFLVDLFAFNLDPQRSELLKSILTILIIGLIFNSANYVNQRLLNAEMKFSLPYILEILYPFIITVILLYILIFNQNNIELLAYARIFGIFMVFLSGILLIQRIGIPIQLRLWHPMSKKFIKNSFTMRLGHNIHNLLFNPITTNILSSFPIGYASCFYYAQMIILAINSIVLGPSNKVLLSKVSELWAEQKFEKILGIMKNYLKNTVPIFIVIIIIAYLLIPYVLNLINNGSLTLNNLDLIKWIFLGLSIWYLIILIESAFTPIGIVSKNSRVFIFTNTIFISLFFSISFLFKNQVGVLVIPLAAIIGQIVNFILYSNFALKKFGTSPIFIIKQKTRHFFNTGKKS
ncbi:MAG: putative membrane protein, putative virulence factor [Methanobacterium sp. Maddingley MBC34]|nr:MAG: putative membrane protein, putative virulence factor [Methanobacterium sp. Maddingley MBC34]